MIGTGTKIEGKISCSIIGANVTIKKNTALDHSIILNNVIIEENCQLYSCLVGDHCSNSQRISPPKRVFASPWNNYVIFEENTKFSHEIKVSSGATLRDNQVVSQKIIYREMSI